MLIDDGLGTADGPRDQFQILINGQKDRSGQVLQQVLVPRAPTQEVVKRIPLFIGGFYENEQLRLVEKTAVVRRCPVVNGNLSHRRDLALR
ncbi:unnamed protein product [Soboliphyme baturini]|uniref:Plug domain-containing protein n=1 Tax=Soboliphyme baturini TaxID=241478 RepID=A0A183IDP3_9BILA|nr:unnamed protein product [Soboliphyme baturini]